MDGWDWCGDGVGIDVGASKMNMTFCTMHRKIIAKSTNFDDGLMVVVWGMVWSWCGDWCGDWCGVGVGIGVGIGVGMVWGLVWGLVWGWCGESPHLGLRLEHTP